jgi:hypothetical protein
MASKNAIKVIHELPLANYNPIDDVASSDIVRFDIIPDRVCYRGAIRFTGVVARRERAESCSTPWHREAYDKLVEVENSDWLNEIYADTGESYRKYWKEKHHYMIGVNDAPIVEVIADSWELMPEEKGEWPRIKLT